MHYMCIIKSDYCWVPEGTYIWVDKTSVRCKKVFLLRAALTLQFSGKSHYFLPTSFLRKENLCLISYLKIFLLLCLLSISLHSLFCTEKLAL